MAWQPQLLTEVEQEIEWRLCERDPTHFLERWWCIVHTDRNTVEGPRSGIIPFRPLPYQREVLDLLSGGCERLLVLKARQIGFTTLMVGYMVWMAMFHGHSLVIIVSQFQSDARDLIADVRDAGLNYLPDWMTARVGITNRSIEVIRFSNGSRVESAAAVSEPARGKTPRLVILDEWARYSNSGEVWASVQPAISHGGSVIALSTAAGAGTPFHKQWLAAVEGTNGFTPRFYSWAAFSLNRDDDWYAQQKTLMTDTALAEEYPATAEEAFIYSGHAVFPRSSIEKQGPIQQGPRGRIVDGVFKPSVNQFEEGSELEHWLSPVPGMAYCAGMDVAGTENHNDFTSIHVVDETGRVCAHWHGNPEDVVDMAVAVREVAEYYNNAFINIEVNGGFGPAVVDLLFRSNYDHFIYQERQSGRGYEFKPGFYSSPTRKRELMGVLAVALVDGRMCLPCADTLRELSEFEAKPGNKLGAPGAGHDDRVISLALAVAGAETISGVPTPETVQAAPTNTIDAFIARSAASANARSGMMSSNQTLLKRYTQGRA